MAWIETVEPGEATGQLKAYYDAAIQRSGKVYGIVKLMSPEPRTLQASMGLYMACVTHPKAPLPRWFRELIAVTVSRLNHCLY